MAVGAAIAVGSVTHETSLTPEREIVFEVGPLAIADLRGSGTRENPHRFDLGAITIPDGPDTRVEMRAYLGSATPITDAIGIGASPRGRDEVIQGAQAFLRGDTGQIDVPIGPAASSVPSCSMGCQRYVRVDYTATYRARTHCLCNSC